MRAAKLELSKCLAVIGLKNLAGENFSKFRVRTAVRAVIAVAIVATDSGF